MAKRVKTAWTSDGSDITPLAERVMVVVDQFATEGETWGESSNYQEVVNRIKDGITPFVMDITQADVDCLEDYNYHIGNTAIAQLRTEFAAYDTTKMAQTEALKVGDQVITPSGTGVVDEIDSLGLHLFVKYPDGSRWGWNIQEVVLDTTKTSQNLTQDVLNEYINAGGVLVTRGEYLAHLQENFPEMVGKPFGADYMAMSPRALSPEEVAVWPDVLKGVDKLGSKTASFVVWTNPPERFESMEEAIARANEVFEQTGVVVGVEGEAVIYCETCDGLGCTDCDSTGIIAKTAQSLESLLVENGVEVIYSDGNTIDVPSQYVDQVISLAYLAGYSAYEGDSAGVSDAGEEIATVVLTKTAQVEDEYTPCPRCDGSGICPNCNGNGCEFCNGDGKCTVCSGNGRIAQTVRPCPECGAKMDDGQNCPSCGYSAPDWLVEELNKTAQVLDERAGNAWVYYTRDFWMQDYETGKWRNSTDFGTLYDFPPRTEYDLVGQVDETSPERVWERMNIGDHGGYSVRSMSVGDVVVIDGKAHIAKDFGFGEYPGFEKTGKTAQSFEDIGFNSFDEAYDYADTLPDYTYDLVYIGDYGWAVRVYNEKTAQVGAGGTMYINPADIDAIIEYQESQGATVERHPGNGLGYEQVVISHPTGTMTYIVTPYAPSQPGIGLPKQAQTLDEIECENCGSYDVEILTPTDTGYLCDCLECDTRFNYEEDEFTEPEEGSDLWYRQQQALLDEEFGEFKGAQTIDVSTENLHHTPPCPECDSGVLRPVDSNGEPIDSFDSPSFDGFECDECGYFTDDVRTAQVLPVQTAIECPVCRSYSVSWVDGDETGDTYICDMCEHEFDVMVDSTDPFTDVLSDTGIFLD